MADFTIIPLNERPELVDACAAWSYGEWGTQIETRNLMKVYEDYKASMEDDQPPITWVAVLDNKPASMVRLKKTDHIEREDLCPWLSSLFVRPKYRGQGISARLCARAEQAAKAYGYDEIYLFTGSAEGLYKKLGYENIGKVTDRSGFHKNGEPLMMKKLNQPDLVQNV